MESTANFKANKTIRWPNEESILTKKLVMFQNGSVESVLHSPGDSSDGSNNPVGAPGTDATNDASTTIVDSSHYITVTGLSNCHDIVL